MNEKNPLKAALDQAKARANTIAPKSDVVLTAVKPKCAGRDRGCPKTVWLFESELNHLEDVELYCRNHGVKADASKLLRTALKLLKKDTETVKLVQATMA